jgi:ATP-dependent exoDNAse (exonuclease V) alpha subunit
LGPERPDRLEASPSDLNDERKIAVLAATPNEWSILVFDGRTIGKKENVATLLNVARSQYRRMPVSELSEDLQRKIRESQPQP